ncbi:MAG TPA: hypothetical protein VM884_08285 [Flavisolibacter sp.]|jgi:hypothetical protein|nr:hypothetical protein [Flavisolibacter sp.]
MKNYNRDLLLLYKDEVYNDDLLQKEVECLHEILMRVECNDHFCSAHELVTRNRITQKPKSIIKAIAWPDLKPFHFLLNKN